MRLGLTECLSCSTRVFLPHGGFAREAHSVSDSRSTQNDVVVFHGDLQSSSRRDVNIQDPTDGVQSHNAPIVPMLALRSRALFCL